MAVVGLSTTAPVCSVSSKRKGTVAEVLSPTGEYEIARILDERKDQFLIEWADYESPSWEAAGVIYDKKGRCLCPTVLEEWRLFQASLDAPIGVTLPCRIRITTAERHEVTEEQLAQHCAFLVSKAWSKDTARSYCRLGVRWLALSAGSLSTTLGP